MLIGMCPTLWREWSYVGVLGTRGMSQHASDNRPQHTVSDDNARTGPCSEEFPLGGINQKQLGVSRPLYCCERAVLDGQKR